MDAEVRFAFRAVPGMAGMQMRLVNHAEALRLKRLAELLLDKGLDRHDAAILFSEDEARQVGSPSVGATLLNENMTLALRVAFETEGKLILFGDSYEVTPDGPKSLTW